MSTKWPWHCRYTALFFLLFFLLFLSCCRLWIIVFCLRYTKSHLVAHTPVQTTHPWNFLIGGPAAFSVTARCCHQGNFAPFFSPSLSLSDACFSSLEGHQFFIYLQVLIIGEPTKAIIACSKKKCFCSLPRSVIKANLERLQPERRSQQPARFTSLERKVCRRLRKQVCVCLPPPTIPHTHPSGKKKKLKKKIRQRCL